MSARALSACTWIPIMREPCGFTGDGGLRMCPMLSDSNMASRFKVWPCSSRDASRSKAACRSFFRIPLTLPLITTQHWQTLPHAAALFTHESRGNRTLPDATTHLPENLKSEARKSVWVRLPPSAPEGNSPSGVGWAGR